MNIFAAFQVFQKSNYASIYTVTIEREGGKATLSEYEDFLDLVDSKPGLKNDLAEINAQIVRIVDEGVSAEKLRHEGEAKALPGKEYGLVTADFVPNGDGPLRLYCVLLPDNVMVLCNGAQKTAGVKSAQDCPNVYPHFQFANRLAHCLDRRLKDEPGLIDYQVIERILENENLQL